MGTLELRERIARPIQTKIYASQFVPHVGGRRLPATSRSGAASPRCCRLVMTHPHVAAASDAAMRRSSNQFWPFSATPRAASTGTETYALYGSCRSTRPPAVCNRRSVNCGTSSNSRLLAECLGDFSAELDRVFGCGLRHGRREARPCLVAHTDSHRGRPSCVCVLEHRIVVVDEERARRERHVIVDPVGQPEVRRAKRVGDGRRVGRENRVLVLFVVLDGIVPELVVSDWPAGRNLQELRRIGRNIASLAGGTRLNAVDQGRRFRYGASAVT